MWGPGWGMMGGGYGSGYYGYGPAHMIIWVVVIVAIVVGVIWLVRSAGMCGMAHHHRGLPPGRSPGLDVLEERYARGEINRDEYLQKKRDITG